MGREILSHRALTGTGNETYLVTDDQGSQYVLRLDGATEHLGVDRGKESEVLELIDGLGLAPTCLLQDDGFKVFEYLDARGTLQPAAVAAQLSRLHQLPLSQWRTNQPYWQPTDTIEHYLKLLPEAKPIFTDTLKDLKRLDWRTQHYGLCHIDLNPTNIIATDDGVRFIDWEYARLGPVVYDLAVLLETSEIKPPDLLTPYAGNIDAQMLDQARRAYRVIERLWYAITEGWPIDKLAAAQRGDVSA